MPLPAPLDLNIVQGSSFSQPVRSLPAAVRVLGVSNAINPTITTDEPHGLSPSGLVYIADVQGAAVNGSWTVLATPTPTTFTITRAAPGIYTGGGIAGTPMDLTSYSGRMTIRDTYGVALLTLTSGSGLTLGGTAGTVVIALTPAQTKALDFVAAVYDLEVYTASDAAVYKLAAGKVRLVTEATR